MTTKRDPQLEKLDRLVGTWSFEATHPAVPGVIVRGSSVIAWLEGERFLIHRSRNDHPDFPDSISIIGFTEQDRVGHTPDADASSAGHGELHMHYYDSRGVSRVFSAGIDDTTWRLWRDSPGFSQRFAGKFADNGDTISGVWQLNQDDAHWHDDLAITYRRAATLP